MEILNCTNCKIKSSAAKTLNISELKVMAEHCSEVSFKRGEAILKQDVFSSNMVYLRKGLVKTHIAGQNIEKIIRISKAPTYLGIATTLYEKTNKYSVTALEDSNVCFIGVDMFKQLIKTNPNFSYEIINDLCKNELLFFNCSINRAQKNIIGRVADSILFFYEEIFKSKEFNLPITRKEFGNFIDTSRESVCRVLSELDNDKIIKVKGKKITILNKKLLLTISKNA